MIRSNARSVGWSCSLAAIAITDIPLMQPMSEVRVVRIDGELSINPSIENLKKQI